MNVTYVNNGERYFGSMLEEEIIKVIEQFNGNIPAYIRIFYGEESNLTIVGGHPTRIVIFARNLQSNNVIINGTLVDTSIQGEKEIEFLAERGGEPDVTLEKYTIEKDEAIRIITHYLKNNNSFEDGLSWSRRWK